MSLGEFELIDRFFKTSTVRDDVVLGAGDDCAVVDVPADKQLVVTTDTLVNGVHFPVTTSPENIAYKSVAVNLSDLAAMGAEPAWVSLSLTLPESDENWLARFASSFIESLRKYNVQLIGGDTTHGPLSITVQAMGLVDKHRIMRRDTASSGDAIYVTGTIGDAATGLSLLFDETAHDEDAEWLINRLNRPQPRVEFGRQAVQYCRCAIDISDGLAADLGHIIKASQCGATVNLVDLPLSRQLINKQGGLDAIDWNRVLTGGDDYELLLVVSADKEQSLLAVASQLSLPISKIGTIRKEPGLSFIQVDNTVLTLNGSGYEHF